MQVQGNLSLIVNNHSLNGESLGWHCARGVVHPGLVASLSESRHKETANHSQSHSNLRTIQTVCVCVGGSQKPRGNPLRQEENMKTQGSRRQWEPFNIEYEMVQKLTSDSIFRGCTITMEIIFLEKLPVCNLSTCLKSRFSHIPSQVVSSWYQKDGVRRPKPKHPNQFLLLVDLHGKTSPSLQLCIYSGPSQSICILLNIVHKAEHSWKHCPIIYQGQTTVLPLSRLPGAMMI